jgi:ubiquinone/menaquinone biosynthesis C-methylase UbiE
MIEKDHFKTEIETLKTIMNIKPGMRFLDVGAGLGKTMTVFSRLDFDVYGFEPSKSFYQKAITQMKIPPDKLKLAMIEEVDYPENYFDFISFDAVLEHLYNPSEAIIKAMKWLKPGGIIFIDVPSSKWLVSKIIKFYYLMIGTDYVGNLSPMHPPFHLFEFSIDSFIKHSSQNNYEIAFYQYFVCETYMPKFLDFFIKPYMKWTNTGLQLCVWLRKK